MLTPEQQALRDAAYDYHTNPNPGTSASFHRTVNPAAILALLAQLEGCNEDYDQAVDSVAQLQEEVFAVRAQLEAQETPAVAALSQPVQAVPDGMGPIGAILAYNITGHGGVCGQTIGADGAGEFVIVFHGTTEEADKAARLHIRALEAARRRFKACLLVHNEEAYSGPAIRHVDASHVVPGDPSQ